MSTPVVLAAEVPTQLSQGFTQEEVEFWSRSRKLIQEELYIIEEVRRSLESADYNRVRIARGRLSSHLSRVERFLERQYGQPERLCQAETEIFLGFSGFSTQQLQVYCTLYRSMLQLEPLVNLLARRGPSLAALATVDPLPPTPEEYPQGVYRRFPFKFEDPLIPRYYRLPEIPEQVDTVELEVNKKAIAGYEPPLPPALPEIPEQAILAMNTSREILFATESFFPSPVRFYDPATDQPAIERLTYGLRPDEVQIYEEFLRQPNTGIIRILNADSYRPDPNRLRDRRTPPLVERYPLAALTLPQEDGYIPRLTLQVEGENFEVMMPGLNYGFLVDLGDVPIEEVSLENLPNLTAAAREQLLNHQPPLQLEAAQDYKRNLLASATEVLPPRVGTSVMAQRKHTYLLRLVQHQLPEAIITGRAISRQERFYLDDILDYPSSDLLIAFRPVLRRLDGTYTVLWKVVEEFPEPRIQDLEEYLELR